ncbi:pre-rRNA-processing protein TSR4 [Sporothrix schenckii 1099-18]|uniref:Pre-rRNA-processing protein TSR4 n=1 Tax=Sporothrix schenckii 1099-18 TaxID=1397361 RepID=A0A0F2MGM7_SPOSC|nr:pre-rRNA-processing protein TSR4 [Sporothrix schenckii 1099-18]KJR88787.1 pre-rRNA-processing protein TSR4 [Sporothrix schenckii 1099-18]
MAPYDSDSSDDEDVGTRNYTETNVLLGYADPEDQDAEDDAAENNETVSRLGGRPDWISGGKAPPSAGLARCLVCKALLVLLLQLNGELPDRFPGHERRLYVLACRNKACRRKPGSVRVIRGVRVDAAVAEAAAAEKAAKVKKAETTQASKTVGAAPMLGNSLFGAANPFSAGGTSSNNANPFSLGGSASPSISGTSNPFSLGGAASAPAAKAPTAKLPTSPSEKTQQSTDDAAKDLPKTFAETLAINDDKSETTAVTTAAPPEPWPPANSWPAAYPVSWIADAEYETLDPTPAAIPGVVTETMEVEGELAGGSGGGKEDKFVFESSMDAAFQKFADRVAQNPDQVIRYEFNGLPLFYNKDDAVAGIWGQNPAGGSISTILASTSGRLPPCPNCRSRRVFEVQLMPHAIDLLEADELGLEGMDWGTVLVAVCEKDCQVQATPAGEASYLEEWAGVQWEDLEAQRR